ncbi:phosphoglucomutase [Candidatus Methanocrinis natronophilus]|uniref:Phosphoglucomutase n=1 Tax=Candidatus Methanocrinis natronophilus TaxID=3033396 RepID=A0ABT5X5R0_9EURY|nr:phosphoglucomutase [Candidatus Methanocrinis natronophilus]MDF0590015.1 phosphoglucomutase [Candidatus Methanocrinis natronophilus]
MTVFRAYDVRGVYGTELTDDIARKVGRALGSYLPGGRIALGRDTRVSGPEVERAFLEGVLSTGCPVERYGVLPISMIGFETWKGGYNAAAYISASHNPPEYNGIRFRTSEGYGMLYHETEMMDLYEREEFLEGEGKLTDRSPDDAILRYADYVEGKLAFDRPLRIVLDMGNGAACGTFPLYQRLGFDCRVTNDSPDGLFPGRGPAPTEESLREAAKMVVAEGADYGVGFDPDADRGLVIDDRGRIVPPEKVAVILAKERYRPGDRVVAGFDCSMILERELLPMGIEVIRERVGDVFIANRVKREGAVIGVERSAHLFLPEFQLSDDPFAMSLALGEVISRGERLSDLSDAIPDYPYVQKSIRIVGSAADLMRRLEGDLASLEPDTTDGLKITAEDYTVLIRPSNTQPLIRLYVETAGGAADELVDRFEKLIKGAAK